MSEQGAKPVSGDLPRVTGYAIARATGLDELARAVNNEIEKGWEPFGPIMVGGYIMQALIRRDHSR